MSGADENLVSPFSVDSWVTIFLCIIIVILNSNFIKRVLINKSQLAFD